jgi:hypothetical protein
MLMSSTIFQEQRIRYRASKDNAMLPALILCAVTAVVFGRIYYQNKTALRLYNCAWNHLLLKLEVVPTAAVLRVGDEYLNPKPNQIATEPVDIWFGLGGIEGIRRMRRNARILIALAAYAERWNFTESVIVTERMRRDSIQLKRSVFQVTLRTYFRIGQVWLPFHLHESVAAYHLMTKRLLALYQTSHAGLYPRLAEVLSSAPSQDATVTI